MFFASLALFSQPVQAQDLELPILSPAASVSQQIGTVEVKVDYFSPAVKGREIYGGLVPYGKLWRGGANRGTLITTSGNITIGGQEVPAGTFKLFFLPAEGAWTVALHENLDASPWTYDESQDLGRFQTTPVDGPARERLVYVFSDTTDRSASLDLEWAGKTVSLPITVDTVGRAGADTEAYVKRASRRLADAARFQLENGDLDRALVLAEQALSLETTWYATWARAEILAKQGEKKAAYAAAKEAMKLGEAADGGFYWKDRVQKALDTWPKR